METVSFKTRVKNMLIESAKHYNDYYLKYSYLLCSNAFHDNDFYIIQANETNFLHLTGVHTILSPKEFFQKCYKATLDESDFDFVKEGKSEKEVIGSVRRKINALPHIFDLMQETTLVEENFKKNTISCSFGAGSTYCTLGFSISKTVKPKSLLKGMELDYARSEKLILVLRGAQGAGRFDSLIVGTIKDIQERKEILGPLLSENLLKLLSVE